MFSCTALRSVVITLRLVSSAISYRCKTMYKVKIFKTKTINPVVLGFDDKQLQIFSIC
jgi:hypothetical protein